MDCHSDSALLPFHALCGFGMSSHLHSHLASETNSRAGSTHFNTLAVNFNHKTFSRLNGRFYSASDRALKVQAVGQEESAVAIEDVKGVTAWPESSTGGSGLRELAGEGETREGGGSVGSECGKTSMKKERMRAGQRFFPKKGEEVEMVCESLAHKNMGVCKVVDTGFVVMCERALPGERLIGRISKIRRAYAEAYKIETLIPHDHAVTPPCEHFPDCGGCKLQNLAYSAQLAAKQAQVADIMDRVGRFGLSGPSGPLGRDYLLPIIGCEQEYHYRNKMEFSFGSRVWLPTKEKEANNSNASGGGNINDSADAHLDSVIASGDTYHEARGMDGEQGVSLATVSNESRERSGEDRPEGSSDISNDNRSSSDIIGSMEVSSGSSKSFSNNSRSSSSRVDESSSDSTGSSSNEGSKRGGSRRRRMPKIEPNPHEFALGLHAPRRFDKILTINMCHLQHDAANQVLAVARQHCESRQHEIPPYDPLTHEGFLRHLTIRKGRDAETGAAQLMVNVMTKRDAPELLRPLVDELVAKCPEVVSIVNNINTSMGDGSVGEKENLLFGKRTITDQLRGLDFEISANSFFQTNTQQADVLYSLVASACELSGTGSEVVLDLFCGTGTIGLSLASRVRHVFGYELVHEAVADARRNAARNGIQNATFVEGDLGKLGKDFGTEFPAPDLIITDPNRPGMHPKLLKFLEASGCPRIVYVSCNPATCARDIDILCHGGGGAEKGGDGSRGVGSQGVGVYELESVQAVDMFPHTPHVECVVVLKRRERHLVS
eukprot:TRINITY_DN19443_c0_g1_i1.p1 TRINITY_DN19443_c0_g1~~TRINITY_DN19443_c0_g1_i1.p1  ORF type:complete len:837 (+),score=124.81 TRINITY_DN19443_c0_g1_i1:182-2512(+)